MRRRKATWPAATVISTRPVRVRSAHQEFCERLKLYSYGYDSRAGRYVIVDRDWRKVKDRLLAALTNLGQPIVHVVDANHANRGELYLKHRFEGVTLDLQDEAIRRIAQIAFEVNERTENIGARRLATVMERLLDEISFDAPNRSGQTLSLDGAAVDADGCSAVPGELRDALLAIVDAIMAQRFEAALDQNGDGKLDALDFVLRSRAGGTR